MFNSTKLRDLSTLHVKPDQTNDSINRSSAASSFIQPKVTSTPVRRGSIFATPPKPRLLSPQRYSLSEFATPPRVNRRDSIRAGSHQNLPGPLLASTKYNVNVSTYEDTKAPGLVSRLVQYHEEAEREKEKRLPTHQAKYGSPGLFPIVHLFKKKLPVLEQKPRHVTVRIASPDNLRQHSQEYQRQLLGSIIKPGDISQQSNIQNSTSPRSVLDALKEISRKRIHSTEVVEIHEDSNSKRIRTENGGVVDSNKRQRDKTPPLENVTSPSKQVSKKICMYDEYAASRSSMDFSVLKKPESQMPKRKSISINTLADCSKDSKQIKLVHAGTQTPAEEADKSTNTKAILNEPNEEENQTKQDQPVPEKRVTPLKVFDDAPLERIRKNRLAALLGSLAGVDPVLEPKPDKASLLNDDVKSSEASVTEKPLVSILTNAHKTPDKADKHVHFNIPEGSTQSSNSSLSLALSSSVSNGVISTTPLVPTSESQSKSNPLGFVATPISTPSFSLGKLSSTSAPALNSGKDKIDAVVSPPLPSFSLPKTPSSTNLPTTSSSAVPSTTFTLPSAKPSPPKMGGFKFDLNKPSTPSASTSNGASLPSGPATSIPKLSFGNLPSSSAVTSSTASFSFGPKPTATVSADGSGIRYGASTPTTTTVSALTLSPIVSSSVAPSFNIPTKTEGLSFGGTTTTLAPNPSASVPSPFGTSSAVASNGESAKPAIFSFGGSTVSSPPSFAFGPPKTTVASSSTTSISTTPINTGFASTTPDFGTAPSSGFGTMSGFGATTTAPALGGFTTTPALSSFTTASSASSGSTTTAPNLGGFTTTDTTAGAGFGSSAKEPFVNKSMPTFGALTTSAPPAYGTNNTFTSSPTPSFNFNQTGTSGNSLQASFGGTAVTQSSGFGVPTTNNAPFGANTAFGSTVSTAAPSFGNNTTTPTFNFGAKTTASSTFGGFGAPTTANNTFGTPTTTNSTFGAPSVTNNTFGAPTTTNSTFGAPSATNNTFGASTTTKSTFGAPTTTNSTFGAPTTTNSTFGAPTTTNSTFGAPSATNSTFGAPTTTNSTFGAPSATNNTFGASTTTKSTFGAPSATNSNFGAPTTTNNNFGAPTTTNNTFGAPSATNNTFGAPSATNNSFGGGFATSTTTSNAFGGFGGTPTTTVSSSFGGFGAVPTTASNVFGGFGPATTTPSFTLGTPSPAGFGTGTPATSFGPTSAPGFGGFGAPSQGAGFSSPTAFGTSQPQSLTFGAANPTTTQSGVFNFGAAPKPGGVFSFGSSAPTDKPKFDFSGGSSAAPAFGMAQNPVAGTFSIGSGSQSSGRNRAQIKAKRRT